jgi:hypothetical protein
MIMGEVPATLYHYTSFDAFRRIMETEIVRGTHYSEFDDWSEVEMGLKMVQRSLEAHPADVHADAKDLLQGLTDVFGRGERDIFVLSLSEDQDSLSQWRGYSAAGGVAIGFKGPGLDVHFRENSKKAGNGGRGAAPWHLLKCQYHDPDETIDLQQMLSDTNGLLDDIRDATNQLARDAKDIRLTAASISRLEQMCCAIKHHAYASEKEWRCFCTLTDDTPLTVHLSDRNRRYVEIPFVAHEVIKEVVLSPHGDKRIGRSLAQYFRSAKKLEYEITESRIPFRK